MIQNRRAPVPWTLTALALTGEAFLGLAGSYLLVLLGAAAARRPRQAPAATTLLTFAVLVPAHNEEGGIAATIRSLAAIDYPSDRYEIIVIADNCDDHTGAVARAHGATVWERTMPRERGKGHALAWALARLHSERPHVEAVAVVDADCSVTPNLLGALGSRLRGGADAAQCDVIVANPDASWSSALRYAAFILMSTIRRLGKNNLGLSCGLHGTGMAFSRETCESVPWEAFSLAEDSEQHMRLVAAGRHVAFVPEAAVRSDMPTSLRQSQHQQMRYEGGKWNLVRTWTPRLLADGVRRRDIAMLHAGLEPLVPPQALLMAGNLALAALAPVLKSRVLFAGALVNLVGQGVFVVGGLILIRAPLSVYRALLFAPALMLWKVGLHIRILLGRGPQDWVRAPRNGDSGRVR